MTLALANIEKLDPYAAWQAANGAAWCQRLSATITANQCAINMEQSAAKSGDLRCSGCAGLDNQHEPTAIRPSLKLLRAVDKIASALDDAEADRETARAARHNRVVNDENLPELESLNGVIEELFNNPIEGDDFDDLEIDLDDEQLLQLFPELAGGDEITGEEERRFKEYQTEVPRRAVYHGRCQRCDGFMENTRERQDDNVFRCLACGWRVGPEYSQNRQIYAAGGIR